MTVDMTRVRREDIRWQVLLTLNNARPIGAYEELVLSVIRATYTDATALELRRELDYLADRDLLSLRKEPTGRWHCELNRAGVDVTEYTVDCDPGIGRPAKYWG
jgi:hypothetical protein